MSQRAHEKYEKLFKYCDEQQNQSKRSESLLILSENSRSSISIYFLLSISSNLRLFCSSISIKSIIFFIVLADCSLLASRAFKCSLFLLSSYSSQKRIISSLRERREVSGFVPHVRAVFRSLLISTVAHYHSYSGRSFLCIINKKNSNFYLGTNNAYISKTLSKRLSINIQQSDHSITFGSQQYFFIFLSLFNQVVLQVQRYFNQMQTLLSRSRQLAHSFISFVNHAVSPYHAVEWFTKHLCEHGFTELREIDNWELQAGKKYFFTRNFTTVVAFAVGKEFKPEDTGFKIIGTHTDSPCLRLNPVSKASNRGIDQCHVSTYGGGLWHTWFDRDLILAGRVVYQEQGRYTSKLWRSGQPLLKIPNLAIHLSSDREKFEPNKEHHLKPVLDSKAVKQQLEQHLKNEGKIFSKHNEGIVKLISTEIGVSAEKIIDFDLCFADGNPSQLVGLNQDFISSPRLDNLFSSFHALTALTSVQNNGSFINMAALFDHEQCGSQSAQGAGSNIVIQSLYRIFKLLVPSSNSPLDGFERTIQRSFFVSADMAHAVHPNYAEKHHPTHDVGINRGVVAKVNYNQRYSSDLVSTSILKVLAEKANVPIQEFVVRNDSACGSTIGPIVASKTGIKSVDVGAPMWGMHSIRETGGVLDGAYYRDLFVSFYNNYEKINHDLLGQ